MNHYENQFRTNITFAFLPEANLLVKDIKPIGDPQ